MSEPIELPGGTIMPIGHVAAQNIKAALKAQHGIDAGAEAIEQAIKDEIQMMGSHFSMAVSEMQAQYEADLLKVKRSVAGIVASASQNVWVIVGAAAALLAVGVVIGRVL